MAGLSGAVGGKPALVAGYRALRLGEFVRLLRRPQRVEHRRVRRLRDLRERACERMDEDQRPARPDGERVTAQAEREAERDRGDRDGIGRLPRHVRPDPRHADDEGVHGLDESRTAQSDPTQQSLRVRDGRRSRRRRSPATGGPGFRECPAGGRPGERRRLRGAASAPPVRPPLHRPDSRGRFLSSAADRVRATHP